MKSKLLSKFSKWDQKKILAVGYVLEFYDLYLFIHLNDIIQKQFFPNGSFISSDFFRYMNFYCIAPISCIFFAKIGDFKGRKPIILGLSMLMAISTFLITILPTYAEWGPYAGYALIFLRILQGISLGAEPTAVNVMMIEKIPDSTQHLKWVSVLASLEQVGGAAVLGIAFFSMNYFGDYSWCWRIPFAVSALFIFFVSIMRYFLTESPEYLEARARTKIDVSNKENLKLMSISKITNKFEYRNFICLLFLFSIWPMIHKVCIIHLTPKLAVLFPVADQTLSYTIMSINEKLTYITIFTFLFFGLLAAYRRWKVETIKKVSIAKYMAFPVCAVLFSLNIKSNSPSFNFLVFLMGAMLCSDLFIWPFITKSFPTLTRLTYVGLAWASIRLCCFFIIGFLLPYIDVHYGVDGLLLFSTFFCMIGIIAVCNFKPLDKQCVFRDMNTGKVYDIL
jgi:MFS family permease